MAQVVKTVEKIAAENQLTVIDSLTLQIGEIVPVVPKYIEDCYPAVIDGTMLQETKLNIEILPANAICSDCKKVFHFPENNKSCPYCGCMKNEIISGKEFLIKEIVAC